MLEPAVSSRPSVVALAAIVTLALAPGGCQRDETAPDPAPGPASPPDSITSITPPATLDRAGILKAMDSAASAYAAGRADSGMSLVGRRFVIRQAFGCAGPTAPASDAGASDGQATWSWSEDRKSLKLSLSPGDWTASPLVSGGADSWEAAEGIWLTRPWLRSDGCPGTPVDPLAGGPPTASPQTMGLASVFENDGSRLGRRNGRAYDFIARSEGSQPIAAPAQGYRLLLEGRMVAFQDGSAVRCGAANADQRPVCIGAVQLDRVAFEDAAGVVLSEWRGG